MAMQRRHSLSTKLVTIGSVLLIIALLSIGLTLWVTWQLEGGAAAVNEAGRMRMQIWRLNSTAQSKHSEKAVADLVNEFSRSLALLKAGDPARPLFMPLNDEVGARFRDVQSHWATNRSIWMGENPPDVEQSLAATSETVAAVDKLVTAIEQQLSRLTAILNLFQFVMMALAIAGAVIMLYTGYLYVINPLESLQQALRSIQSGNFAARVEVDTDDEFGQVASGFNGMAAELQGLYEGLETQVKVKTQHIEAQRARLESLYEISAFSASAASIEELSRGFAKRVRAVVGADAVAVRWSDEANQRYLMLASDCFPHEMLEAERSLLAGACACGNLKPDARTRVIPIVEHEASPMRACARAGYVNIVSVPVRLQQRLLGEIDLFFRSSVELSSEEKDLLDALASHLASGLESLRAAALEREAAVGEERALLARELHDSIAQSLSFLKIQVQLLRNASRNAQQEKVQTALDELDTGLRESINDVRELLVHFRTRTNTGDVEAALQETLQKFKHQTGMTTHFQVSGQGIPLPADVQVQVLHVVQEALSNVRKHAQATQVYLDVTKGEEWRFVVRDDGRGFGPEIRDRQSTHVGMKIMQERASRIGATVQVRSELGQGTTVQLTLPAHPVSGANAGGLSLDAEELASIQMATE
ncbi:type IV pili methyl-accepting chemotaxis transducer N-terminal domain-containing protein [Rhodoferax sp. GW822-FHT02A01]|uniref:type IV pili methyl-accepting chemotaxis transducer N-terminal domain-containing protein n=1 Tax=Rhodoferax sp. GW822-FHT02A01 TaxID=3141537 RepID=UPI00315C8B7B